MAKEMQLNDILSEIKDYEYQITQTESRYRKRDLMRHIKKLKRMVREKKADQKMR